jgi:hypothetical protein
MRMRLTSVSTPAAALDSAHCSRLKGHKEAEQTNDVRRQAALGPAWAAIDHNDRLCRATCLRHAQDRPGDSTNGHIDTGNNVKFTATSSRAGRPVISVPPFCDFSARIGLRHYLVRPIALTRINPTGGPST